MTEVKQDPGEVFAALALAFGQLKPEDQSAAIDEVYNALSTILEQRLDDTGIPPEEASEHDGLRPLMMAVNMVRAVFGSRGRVHVFRANEAALIATQLHGDHVDLRVIDAADGARATEVLRSLAATLQPNVRSTLPPS
jgi:hypothetical protein